MRHLNRLLPRLVILGIAVAAGPGVALGGPAVQEGTLFTGATVFAGFDGRRADALRRPAGASAVLVEQGRIVAIGAEGELASTDAGRRARRVDLTGGFIYPGFQDANGQLERLGRDLEQVDLADCAGGEALVNALQERAATLPAGRWVEAFGWDSVRQGGGSAQERAELAATISRALPQHPVVLRARSRDGLLLNRAGWAACGAEADAGGAGDWLQGEAATAALSRLPSPTAEDRTRRILRAQETLLRSGPDLCPRHGPGRRRRQRAGAAPGGWPPPHPGRRLPRCSGGRNSRRVEAMGAGPLRSRSLRGGGGLPLSRWVPRHARCSPREVLLGRAQAARRALHRIGSGE